MKTMKTFKEFIGLQEASDSKLYYQSKELWFAYAQGSGTTAQLPNLNSFITSKPGDSHYDDLAAKLGKYADKVTPIKVSGKTKLFEMPEYEKTNGKFDIFGGDVKPIRMIYVTINQDKYVTVNFFLSKSEALAFI